MVAHEGVIRMEPNGPGGVGLEPMQCDPAAFSSAVPVQHVHVYFSDPKIGINVGVWDTSQMQEAFGPYPGDEFIWVVEGDFEIVNECGQVQAFSQGACVSFRNGVPMSWKQPGYLKKFYITYLDPTAHAPKIGTAEGGVRQLDPSLELEAKATTAPFEIEGPAPLQKVRAHFTNDAGNFHVGTWSSGPMVSKMMPFPTYEFVRMLEGEVIITEENGRSQTFCAGDVFFVAKGTICSWTIKSHVKKHFAVLAV